MFGKYLRRAKTAAEIAYIGEFYMNLAKLFDAKPLENINIKRWI
jgi:hypothetical protein